MSRLHLHPESHLVDRIGWLRAAVLGANDGIVSTASLIVGVAAAAAKQNDVLSQGSRDSWPVPCRWQPESTFSAQSDTERADLARDRRVWGRLQVWSGGPRH